MNRQANSSATHSSRIPEPVLEILREEQQFLTDPRFFKKPLTQEQIKTIQTRRLKKELLKMGIRLVE
jgi:hypothetical protein